MENLLKRNENENNELVAKIFIGLWVFVLFVWLLCYTGVFDFDMIIACCFTGFSSIVLLLPFLVIYKFHVRTPVVKYMLMTILSAFIGICYCIFTFQMIILFVVPMLVAMLYLDKKLLIFTGVTNFVIVICAHVVTMFFILQPWIEAFKSIEDIIRFCIIPRVMQLGLCFVIAYVLINRFLSYMLQVKSILLEKEQNNIKNVEIDHTEKDELDSYFKLLTNREKDIFIQMVSGKTNTQIAETLCLSVGTVKNYISSIYDKLKTRERNYFILKFGRYIEEYDHSNSKS